MAKRNKETTDATSPEAEQEAPVNEPKGSRVKLFLLPVNFLAEAFREGTHPDAPYKVTGGIPRDAKVIRTERNPASGELFLLIEDDSFGEIRDDQDVPSLDPRISKFEKQESETPPSNGDVVQLKSGGPKMTILRVENGAATCAFFGQDGSTLSRAELPIECLKKCECGK